MTKKKKKIKKAPLLFTLATALIFIWAWFNPFGYDMAFWWCQENLFGGDFWTTNLFFYIWTHLLLFVAVGILLYLGVTWVRIRKMATGR